MTLKSESLEIDPLEPGPEPVADHDGLPGHGPFVGLLSKPTRHSSMDVSWDFACYFQIQDEDGGYWNWTYEARIFDPNDTPIATQTGFVNEKPGYQSDMRRTFTDPIAGTYTCQIDWWVQDYHLQPPGRATRTISWPVPTDETTIPNAWSGLIPTAYKWRGQLSGGGFVGRRVMEEDGGNPFDNCYWPQGPYEQMTSMATGGTWDIESGNNYGDDTVGMHWQVIDNYRAAGKLECWYESDQVMKINRPGTSWAEYKTNRLKAGFGPTWVWSQRTPAPAQSKPW